MQKQTDLLTDILLYIGFTSVYQLGRAGRGNRGGEKPITYTQKTTNQIGAEKWPV